MTQLAMTNAERHAALERFGYSEREACFLCLAGLHGGYFLRRQYAAFLGGQDGGNVTQLIEKALDLGHAEAATYKANTHVYHLSARRFYAALGQQDNRNRRRKELLTIKSKLMGLDFVLFHQNNEYLATDQEKRSFFRETFHVESGELPAKHYASHGLLTHRHFVEKYPIFYSPSARAACPPVVSFCFVDPGLAGVSGFETFLSRYAGLFIYLPEFCAIYVATSDALFSKAQNTFERLRTTGWAALNGADYNGQIDKLLEYFEARRLFEGKQFTSFDRAKLIRFRDQQEAYSRPKVDALYQRWKAGGDITSLSNSSPKQGLEPNHSGHFSTCLLKQTYDFFGNIAGH